MKRGAVRTLERDRLKAALSAMPYLCPDCPTRSYAVRWNHDRRAWTVKVLHWPGCPVRRSRHSANQCTAYLRDQLRTAGVMVADYVAHATR